MSAKFKDAEEVLAYAKDGKIYEAKIMRLQKVGAATQYRVHYKGWNNKWDEWKEEQHVMKNDERNRKLMEETNNAAAAKAAAAEKRTGKAKVAESTASDDGAEDSGAPSRKRRIDASREVEDKDPDVFVHSKLMLPLALKLHVADDWDQTVNKGRLLRLPVTEPDAWNSAAASASAAAAPPAMPNWPPVKTSLRSVAGVFDDFLAHLNGQGTGAGASSTAAAGAAASSSAAAEGAAAGPARKRSRKDEDGTGAGASSSAAAGASSAPAGRKRGGAGPAQPAVFPPHVIKAATEVIAALRHYFETSLPLLLLFRQERVWWESFDRQVRPALTAAGVSLAEACPPMLLLRMLVRFPALMSIHAGLEEKEAEAVTLIIQEFVKFLNKNAKNKAYFSEDAYVASSQDYKEAYLEYAKGPAGKTPKLSFAACYQAVQAGAGAGAGAGASGS